MPRATLTEPEIDAFRKRVYQAATHLFAEQGFEAVTLRAIAARVGCSPMTPYRYFADKDEIFAMVRARAHGRFADAEEAAIRGIEDPGERIVALAHAYIQFALDEPDSYRLIFELDEMNMSAYPECLAEAQRSWGVLRTTVGEAVDAGLLSGDPDTLAHVFWGGVHGIVSLHLAGHLQMGRTLDELVSPMIEMMVRGTQSPRMPAERPHRE